MKNRFAALLTLAFSLFAAILSAVPVNFTILHTSDIHAHLQPVASGSEMVGGYARIKAYKDSLEEEGRNVLMLSSGDIFQGTFFYKFFQGIPDIEFMNRTGYAAMTLGNHEFDGGQAALAEALAYARFPILAANIQFKKIPELQSKLKPWVMINAGPAENPVKVAIIGITAENLPKIVPSVFIKDIDVFGAEETLKRYLPEIQMAGAEIILLLSHLGWEKELQLFESFPDLDGILGGHSHLAISPPAIVDGPRGHRFLSEPGEWGKGVTRYDLIFDRDVERSLRVTAAALVPMAENMPEDSQIKHEADGLWQQIQVKVNIPIGKTSVYLNGDREHIRTRETNLGNLVADCVADTVAADMAVMNGGGIRSSIATGTVTIGDCLNVLPFDNYLIKVEMTGATLTKIFEQVREAIGHESGFGGFLQVSRGLQVKYYSNLVVVTYNGQPVEPRKKYTVATNDFLSGGGNGLTAFLESDVTESTGVLAADAFIKYIKQTGELAAVEEGRILINFKLPGHKMPAGILKNIPSKFRR